MIFRVIFNNTEEVASQRCPELIPQSSLAYIERSIAKTYFLINAILIVVLYLSPSKKIA